MNGEWLTYLSVTLSALAGSGLAGAAANYKSNKMLAHLKNSFDTAAETVKPVTAEAVLRREQA